MKIVLTALTQLLLLPYFGWGIYNLRRRYRFHDDVSPTVEASTLVCVTIYLYVQIAVLEFWMEQALVYLIFSVLGLFVSAAALYGHMAISLLGWVIVDFMLPYPSVNADHPRMGPQEALERQKDYQGALEGYLVLARIYPRNIEVSLRIAGCLLWLDRAEEAPGWLERALKNCANAGEALPIVNRLCEVYERVLKTPAKARETLEDFLGRYPEAAEASEVREHLAHVGVEYRHAPDDALVPLAESAIGGFAPEEAASTRQPSELPGLAPIEGPLNVAIEAPVISERTQGRPVTLEIEAMESAEDDQIVDMEDKDR